MKFFDIITIFPETIAPYADASILGRAQKKKLIKINAHDLRDFAKGKHNQVDDTPYGGGPGMVMMVEPIDKAVRKIKKRLKKSRVILTSASGKKFTQADARRLAKHDQLIFICGRYEGVDARVEQSIADEALSIGDYVLTGGELPALVMADAIARNVKGVLGAEESLVEESHSKEGQLEYPQYTKPEEYKNLKVPKVLLSGNHAEIKKWRSEKQGS
ncbi:MAG: tRNA (guanosine(37)-N1)-methyltransferase TrmD [bacterium]